eukprot:6023635-Amphidinium_carterae.1
MEEKRVLGLVGMMTLVSTCAQLEWALPLPNTFSRARNTKERVVGDLLPNVIWTTRVTKSPTETTAIVLWTLWTCS